MNKDRPIGVFDSGIGGLSVLKQFVRFMPYEKYIYLGDNARVPYGNKSAETVKEYAKECTEFLLEKKVKMIVVACNTVSAVAMDAVREVSDVPVIEMIKPAAAAALRATSNGKIAVIGTRATINSKAYPDEIFRLSDSKKIKVLSEACPLFVPIIEEGWIRHDATRLIIGEYLNELHKSGVDTLVLGCTHYPMLAKLLTELYPGLTLIDSGEHAAVSAVRVLAESSVLKEERNEYVVKPEIEFFVSDLPANFNEQAERFLGFEVNSPKRVIPGRSLPK
ncbi:MAG: glutamate racemase [Chlorobi bacterium]|nr:glutamate racemase [Chlorobiota bacterium]